MTGRALLSVALVALFGCNPEQTGPKSGDPGSKSGDSGSTKPGRPPEQSEPGGGRGEKGDGLGGATAVDPQAEAKAKPDPERAKPDSGRSTIDAGAEGLVGRGPNRGTAVPADRDPKKGSAARVLQAKAAVAGQLDGDVIRRVVRRHVGEVRRCYEAGLTRTPDLRGRVEIAFTIGPQGKVRASRVEASTVAEDGVGECIAKAVRRWTFPAPRGGEVEVSYPFELVPE